MRSYFLIIFYFVVLSETVRSYKLVDEANEEVNENPMTSMESKPSEQLIGKTVDEANEMIRNGQVWKEVGHIRKIRVAVEDGEYYLVTADYDPDRIDVEIRNQKIVRLLG